MRRLFLILLLLAMLPAHACMWDRDTLAEEAKGKLDTVKAITGWFDRYPPHYYEMRLDRVTKELAAHPQSLDLYDDAGVACSRLGRHDQALDWMAKKKAVLDALPPAEAAESRYRYLSNTGTFHLIRWIVTPQVDRVGGMADLKASETLIAQALDLNPDAHFGREKFQIMLIRWLLDPIVKVDRSSDNFLREDTHINRGDPDSLSVPSGDFTFEEATKGITGLIQLGAAWQSVDTAYALQTSLGGEGRNYLAQLAFLRRKELLNTGVKSLHPSANVRDRVAEAGPTGEFYEPKKIAAFFNQASAAAAKREATWLAYQEERFAKGMHPDTHPQFWDAWQEPAFPQIPGLSFSEAMDRNPGWRFQLFFVGVFTLILAAIGFHVFARVKRFYKQRQAIPVPSP